MKTILAVVRQQSIASVGFPGEDITGLTFQRLADAGQGIKTDAFDFSRLEQRQVLFGNAYKGRQRPGRHLFFHQQFVQIHHHSHR